MRNPKHFQKTARPKHLASFDLVRSLLIADKYNRIDQMSAEVTREVVLNVLCEDSTFSLAAVCKFVNKAVN